MQFVKSKPKVFDSIEDDFVPDDFTPEASIKASAQDDFEPDDFEPEEPKPLKPIYRSYTPEQMVEGGINPYGAAALATLQETGKAAMHGLNSMAFNVPRTVMRKTGYDLPEAESTPGKILQGAADLYGFVKGPARVAGKIVPKIPKVGKSLYDVGAEGAAIPRMTGKLSGDIMRSVARHAATLGTASAMQSPDDKLIGLGERAGQAASGAATGGLFGLMGLIPNQTARMATGALFQGGNTAKNAYLEGGTEGLKENAGEIVYETLLGAYFTKTGFLDEPTKANYKRGRDGIIKEMAKAFERSGVEKKKAQNYAERYVKDHQGLNDNVMVNPATLRKAAAKIKQVAKMQKPDFARHQEENVMTGNRIGSEYVEPKRLDNDKFLRRTPEEAAAIKMQQDMSKTQTGDRPGMPLYNPVLEKALNQPKQIEHDKRFIRGEELQKENANRKFNTLLDIVRQRSARQLPGAKEKKRLPVPEKKYGDDFVAEKGTEITINKGRKGFKSLSELVKTLSNKQSKAKEQQEQFEPVEHQKFIGRAKDIIDRSEGPQSVIVKEPGGTVESGYRTKSTFPKWAQAARDKSGLTYDGIRKALEKAEKGEALEKKERIAVEEFTRNAVNDQYAEDYSHAKDKMTYSEKGEAKAILKEIEKAETDKDIEALEKKLYNYFDKIENERAENERSEKAKRQVDGSGDQGLAEKNKTDASLQERTPQDSKSEISLYDIPSEDLDKRLSFHFGENVKTPTEQTPSGVQQLIPGTEKREFGAGGKGLDKKPSSQVAQEQLLDDFIPEQKTPDMFEKAQSTDQLIEEAKKYKSAEEFVKSQPQKINKADGITRAVKGGQIGENEYFYKGGQFLPSTTAPKGKWRVKIDGKTKLISSSKAPISPNKWENSPTPFSRSIWEYIRGTGLVRYNEKTDKLNYVQWASKEKFEEELNGNRQIGVMGVLQKEPITAKELIDKYNLGMRWVDVNPGIEITAKGDTETIKQLTDIWNKAQGKQSLTEIVKETKSPQTTPEKTSLEPKAKGSYSVDSHKKLYADTAEGNTTPEALKSAYKELLKNKDAIKAELSKLTKKELGKMLGGYRGSRWQSEKKDYLVSCAYRSMIDDFVIDGDSITWSHGQKYEDVIQGRVDKIDADTIKKYAERVKEARAKRAERTEQFKKALENPETLDDFRNFISIRGKDKLTAEQLEKYDSLIASSISERRKKELERKGNIKQVAADTDFTIEKGTHTKKGIDIWTVKMTSRVERETYQSLNESAKKLGGYYSRFGKGFVFENEADAKAFMKVKEQDVDATEKIMARRVERKNATAQRISDMADTMEEKANERLNADRKTNTHKRATEAAHAEANARKEIAIAKTIRSIADAIERGEAKHLEGITAKTQVELLEGILRQSQRAGISKDLTYSQRVEKEAQAPTREDVRNADFPKLTLWKDHVPGIVNDLKKIKGAILIANRLDKAYRATKGERLVFKLGYQGERLARAIVRKMGKNAPWQLADGLKNIDRLQRMGIETGAQLREALRELVDIRSEAAKEDPLKAAERALVGRKDIGIDFFPTTKKVVDQMLALADIQKGMKVLEPSAGKGDIADALKNEVSEGNLDVVEMSSTLRDMLKLKGHNIVERDFLEHKGEYDRIVMNPPFSNNQDIKHVKHAFDMLKPGGKIVAIMSEHGFFANDKESIAFREWLDTVGTSEKLPENSFKDSFVSTGVNTRIVEIEKPKNRKSFLGEEGFARIRKDDAQLQQEFESLIAEAKAEGEKVKAAKLSDVIKGLNRKDEVPKGALANENDKVTQKVIGVINKRMKKAQANVSDKDRFKTKDLRDTSLSMQDLEKKTGVPFFSKHYTRINKIGNKVHDAIAKKMTEVLGDINKGGLSGESDGRIIDFLVNGKGELKGREQQLASRIKTLFESEKNKIKFLRMKRFLDYGTKIPNATDKQYEIAQKIFEAKGNKGLEAWTKTQDFGVISDGYLPADFLKGCNIEQYQNPFGIYDKHIKSRDGEQQVYNAKPLLQKIHGYLASVYGDYYMYDAVKDFNGEIKDLELPSGTYENFKRWINVEKGHGMDVGVLGEFTRKARGQFFKAILGDPYKMVRNMAQNIAYLPHKYPLTANIKKLVGLKRLNAEEKAFFKENVSQLGSVRSEYMYLYESFFKQGPLAKADRLAQKLSEMYSYTDELNRMFSFKYALTGMDKDMNAYKNGEMSLNKFAKKQGLYSLTDLELKQVLSMPAEKAKLEIAKLITDKTHWRYKRRERGFAANTPAGEFVMSLSTFPKGVLTEAVNQVRKVSHGKTHQERWDGVQGMVGMMIMGQVANKVLDIIMGEKKYYNFNQRKVIKHQPYASVKFDEIEDAKGALHEVGSYAFSLATGFSFGGAQFGHIMSVSDTVAKVGAIIAGDLDSKKKVSLTRSILRDIDLLGEAYMPFLKKGLDGYEAMADKKTVHILRSVFDKVNNRWKYLKSERKNRIERTWVGKFRHGLFGTEGNNVLGTNQD